MQSHFASSDYNAGLFELVKAVQGPCLNGNNIGEEEIFDESLINVMKGALVVKKKGCVA